MRAARPGQRRPRRSVAETAPIPRATATGKRTALLPISKDAGSPERQGSKTPSCETFRPQFWRRCAASSSKVRSIERAHPDMPARRRPRALRSTFILVLGPVVLGGIALAFRQGLVPWYLNPLPAIDLAHP